MKRIKNLTGYLLCFTMVIACISGCGGFAGNDEALLMSAVTNLRKAENFETNVKFLGKVTENIEGESKTENWDVEMTSTQFAEPLKTKIVTKSVDDPTPLEHYVQKEGDKYVAYTEIRMLSNDVEESTRVKSSQETPEEALTASGGGMNFVYKLLAEDISKYTRKEDRKEGDKRYLVYEYKVTGDDVKSLAKSTMSFIGGSLESDEIEMIDAVPSSNMGDVIMTILIDRKTECIDRIEMPITDMMNSLMKGMLDYMKRELIKELGGTSDEEDMEEEYDELTSYFDQMKIEVSDMDMVVTYSKIDAAEDFTIPQEVLKAKNKEDVEYGSDLDDEEEDDDAEDEE